MLPYDLNPEVGNYRQLTLATNSLSRVLSLRQLNLLTIPLLDLLWLNGTLNLGQTCNYGGPQLPFKLNISHSTISNLNISNFKILI